ncbi:MAG: hypothetical protein ACJ8CR_24700, partial [Roseiflexaceae bacterium]
GDDLLRTGDRPVAPTTPPSPGDHADHRTGDRPVAPTAPPSPGDDLPRTGDRPVAPTAPRGPTPKSIGALMAGFKSAVTTRINRARQTPGAPLWQRNYWEHIIRDDAELNRIREYIRDNPARWEADTLYERPTDRR